jgi:hypothetical protein
MTDLIAALGLAFVIEGLLWALFPRNALTFLELISTLPEATVRRGAVAVMAIGVFIVWLARG